MQQDNKVVQKEDHCKPEAESPEGLTLSAAYYLILPTV